MKTHIGQIGHVMKVQIRLTMLRRRHANKGTRRKYGHMTQKRV